MQANQDAMPRAAKTFLVVPIFALLISLSASPVWALKSDKDEPIRIRAKSVEIDEKTGIAVYLGNVSVSQGSMRITAAKLEVRTRNNQTESIRAFGGPATLRQLPDNSDEEVHLSAKRVEYRVVKREVQLYDNVILRRGDDVVMAAYMRYHLDDEQFTASGGGNGGRVSAVIHPKAESAKGTPSP